MTIRCDIVVPVYNAPKSVSACLDSLLRYTDPERQRIIVVNDSSDEFTSSLLAGYKDSYKGRVVLLHNEHNLGFLQTANRGISYSDAATVCLLNSDTVVASADWLQRMMQRMAEDETIGIVSPLSNAAVNLSVHLHPGADIALMSALVGQQSQHIYPDAVTIVGFCMVIKREVINRIGGFDEVFGRGYCEESDYHYRALEAGFSCKVADDVFVYHEGEASFSGAREEQYTSNRKIFDQRWARHYERDIDEFNHHNELGYLRSDYPQYYLQQRRLHDEYDMLFVLLSFETYGGVITIVDLVNQMVLAGLKANIIYVNDRRPHLSCKRYFEPIYLPEEQLTHLAPKAQVYVATHFLTTTLVYDLVKKHQAKSFYFIQDDERQFGEGYIEHINFGYRLIPNHVYVADWLNKALAANARFATTISNGIHTDVFYPAAENRPASPALRITMMTRYDEKRGYTEGIKAIKNLLGEKTVTAHLRFDFFGERDVSPQGFAEAEYHYHGILDKEAVAKLLRQTDIFIDASRFQGFGLTALEAMASGCAVIMPREGGGPDFGIDGENLLFFTGGDAEALSRQLRLLVDSARLRGKLQRQARQTAERFSIYQSVRQFMEIYDNRAQWLEDVPDIPAEDYYQHKIISMTMKIKELENQVMSYQALLCEKSTIIDYLKSR